MVLALKTAQLLSITMALIFLNVHVLKKTNSKHRQKNKALNELS